MTRPPEYGQVAQWLRAISGDSGLLEDIKARYSGPGDVPGNGQALEEYAEQQRQRLADEARLALMWIDLEGKSLDEIAQAYHQDQVAKYARRQHVLQERIRELTDGDFEVPPWCASRAVQNGLGLDQVIEDHQQGELSDAQAELGLLPGRYDVTVAEVEAYWAARHLAAAQHLIDEHGAEPDHVARDAPTLDELQGIHDAAHKYRHVPWGQLVMQARADAWWAERNRQYRNQPEVLEVIERLQAEGAERRVEEDAHLRVLERGLEAGSPWAQSELDEELTWQALEIDPPEPSAREDPGEWRAFFREVLGRDMPLNAAHEAENYRIDATAPDVFGRAAAYAEVHCPMGFGYSELAAERQGMPMEQLYAQRYRELQASHRNPGAVVTGTEAARLAGASFPGPVHPSPPRRVGHEASRRAPQPGPHATRGWGR